MNDFFSYSLYDTFVEALNYMKELFTSVSFNNVYLIFAEFFSLVPSVIWVAFITKAMLDIIRTLIDFLE